MAIRFKKATKDAARHGIDLGVLKREEGIADGSNLGGQFRLPAEFNSKQFASQFSEKGSSVAAAKQRQTLAGTDVSADGWSVWTFPEGHECAGQPYEVATHKHTFILLYRDMKVQEAVNFVYGEASRDRMLAEVHGETVAGNSPDDPGVLTEEVLNRVPHLRREREEIEQDRERDAQSGRQTALHAAQRPKGKVITKKKTKLTK